MVVVGVALPVTKVSRHNRPAIEEAAADKLSPGLLLGR